MNQQSHRKAAQSAPPLLEREAEIAVLQAMLDGARDGDGRLVVIEGSAGIGKTRLLTEARELALSLDLDVLSARAGELEGDFAYGVVRQLFEPMLAASDADSRAELLSGAAALAEPLFAAVPTSSRESGVETSFAMLHGLYWLAANIAFRTPTLLVADDVHWADDPSLHWLAYLARRLEGLPLLLIVGTRPSEQAREPVLVTELAADPLATVLRPRALGNESAAVLARDRLGVEPDPAFSAALQAGTGGNPLYLRALLDSVWREQIAPDADQAAHVLELGPQAVARGIALRLARLPDDARALIRAAAILGDRTDLQHAATLAQLDIAAAGRAATALVRSDLFRDDNPIEFIHPVVRTAIYGEMGAGDRLSGHRQAAQTLLGAGLPPEAAAAHLLLTVPQRDGFVVATLREAAKRSLAQGAPEAAVAYLKRALEEPPTLEHEGDVLGDLGIAEAHTFTRGNAVDHLREAVAKLDDPASRPDLLLTYVRSLSMQTERAGEAVELVRRLSARTLDDRILRDRIEAAVVIAAWFDPAFYPIARTHWDAAAAGKAGIEAGVLLATGAMEETRRGVDRARVLDLARRAIASDLADKGERIYLVNALYALTLAGDVELAVSAADDAVERAQRAGDQFSTANFHLWAGVVRAEQGDLLAAEERFTTTEVTQATEPPTHFAYRAGFLVPVLLDRGARGEAETLCERARIDTVQPGHRISFLSGRGRLYLETGRPEPALADLLTAGEIANSIGIENPAFAPWRSQAALALRQLDRVEEAREFARDELELSRRWGAPRTIGISLRALGLVEGGATGEQLLREAVSVLAESRARLEHARALIDLGAALRRRNSRSEARKQLRDGIELAHQCGANALVERANDELAATGAHRRTILLSGLDALTASERRVAQMAAEGSSNKEIAQALFVTVKTVEMHLGRVYRKLELSSRAQLAGALNRPVAEVPTTT